VLYDGECSLCVGLAQRCESLLRRHGFAIAPLQSSWVVQRLGRRADEGLTEMGLLTADGRSRGGADALIYLAGRIWWGWPLFALAHLPGMRPILWRLYRWIANRRHCFGGACQVPGRAPRRNATAARSARTDSTSGHRTRRVARFAAWLPLLVLPLVSISLSHRLPPWMLMWALAFSLYAGCKWLTWIDALRDGARLGLWHSLAYLLVWPGMDPEPFTTDAEKHAQPAAAGHPALAEWLKAAIKILLGTLLLGLVGRWTWPQYPLLTGWIVLAGVAIALHFGLFELLALCWRRAGIDVQPIMHRPLRATSLREFWNTRWNRAFHDLAYRYIFRPTRRRFGAGGALLLAFAISGLIHDLVISFPARGGYGLPTAYFLLQAAGVRFERARIGRRIGLGRGRRGWMFVIFVVALPALALFHPPFVTRVVLPFAQAIGAL
jgi:alginate O-acetyltransferase complex protein AlgI